MVSAVTSAPSEIALGAGRPAHLAGALELREAPRRIGEEQAEAEMDGGEIGVKFVEVPAARGCGLSRAHEIMGKLVREGGDERGRILGERRVPGDDHLLPARAVLDLERARGRRRAFMPQKEAGADVRRPLAGAAPQLARPVLHSRGALHMAEQVGDPRIAPVRRRREECGRRQHRRIAHRPEALPQPLEGRELEIELVVVDGKLRAEVREHQPAE
jgi:hypothetical protein